MRANKIRNAYATWADTRGADPSIWDPIMGPDFEFRTTLGSIPGSGFKDRYRRDEIPDYFRALDGAFEMTSMSPTLFVEDGETVVSLFDVEWMHRTTKRSFRCDVAAIWTFDGELATSYRELLDTAGVARTLP